MIKSYTNIRSYWKFFKKASFLVILMKEHQKAKHITMRSQKRYPTSGDDIITCTKNLSGSRIWWNVLSRNVVYVSLSHFRQATVDPLDELYEGRSGWLFIPN